jgi:hypothetical protein
VPKGHRARNGTLGDLLEEDLHHGHFALGSTAVRIEQVIVLAVHKQSAIEVVELGALELGAELQGGENKLVGGLALVGLQFGAQLGVGAERLVQMGVAIPQAQQLVRCARRFDPGSWVLAFGRLGLARVLAQVLGVDLEREVARLRPLQVVQVAHLVESEGGESALLVCYHQRQTFTTSTVK